MRGRGGGGGGGTGRSLGWGVLKLSRGGWRVLVDLGGFSSLITSWLLSFFSMIQCPLRFRARTHHIYSIFHINTFFKDLLEWTVYQFCRKVSFYILLQYLFSNKLDFDLLLIFIQSMQAPNWVECVCHLELDRMPLWNLYLRSYKSTNLEYFCFIFIRNEDLVKSNTKLLCLSIEKC